MDDLRFRRKAALVNHLPNTGRLASDFGTLVLPGLSPYNPSRIRKIRRILRSRAGVLALYLRVLFLCKRS